MDPQQHSDMQAFDGEMPEYTVVLVGNRGVGKTTFAGRHLTGEFDVQHIPTDDEAVYSLVFTMVFYFNRGPIKFIIWVSSGQGIPNGVNHAHGAIFMFDVTSPRTILNAPFMYHDLKTLFGDIPIVVCGNKVDLEPRMVQAALINDFVGRHPNLQYYDTSSEENYNFEKPFLWLARKWTGNNRLRFVETPALPPPEDVLDEATMAQYAAELAVWANEPFDDDDE